MIRARRLQDGVQGSRFWTGPSLKIPRLLDEALHVYLRIVVHSVEGAIDVGHEVVDTVFGTT